MANNDINSLQALLATYSVFSQNTKNLHWNIKGDNFFVLHQKFEELYNDLSEKIDEIAELILTLDNIPETRFSAYLKTSAVTETDLISDDKIAVQTVCTSLQTLVDLQQLILDSSEEEVVLAQMSDNVREQKKLLWMYKAYLG